MKTDLNTQTHLRTESPQDFSGEFQAFTVTPQSKPTAISKVQKQTPIDYGKLLLQYADEMETANILIQANLARMRQIEYTIQRSSGAFIELSAALQREYVRLYDAVGFYVKTIAATQADVKKIPPAALEEFAAHNRIYQGAAEKVAPAIRAATAKLFSAPEVLVTIRQAGLVTMETLEGLFGKQLLARISASLGLVGKVACGSVASVFMVAWFVIQYEQDAHDEFFKRVNEDPEFAREYENFMAELARMKEDKSFHPVQDNTQIIDPRLLRG